MNRGVQHLQLLHRHSSVRITLLLQLTVHVNKLFWATHSYVLGTCFCFWGRRCRELFSPSGKTDHLAVPHDIFASRWWRETRTPTPQSSTTSTLRSSPAISGWSPSPECRPPSAWEWSCTAVRGRVGHTNTKPHCKMRMCSLTLLTLEVVDSMDLDFNRFSEMFTPPERV